MQQQSRLRRSYDSRLTNRDEVRAFCNEHGIPYCTEFHNKTQPTPEIKQQFDDAYRLAPLSPTDLPHKGMSTALVFEQPQIDKESGEQKLHGEMVASVADRVGNNLEPGTETLYVQTSAYHASRKAWQPELLEPVDALIRNQGVPVIHTSIGWNDTILDFDHGFDEQSNELWNATAFVVISAGNDGRYGEEGDIVTPSQKHTSASHVPPLALHVGAAAKDKEGHWHIEGYSSANGPALVAPVAPDKKALWSPSNEPKALIGTSLAAPYISGVLTALNRRYGPYLTREQILYALLATCSPLDDVKPFAKKTPERVELEYITNAAGLRFNPEYAGFGLVDPYKADLLLSQMVAKTQQHPQSISVPVEERVRMDIPEAAPDNKDADGNYIYELSMPAGAALKTTLDLEFTDDYGDVTLVSPSGTKVPLTISRLHSKEKKVPFGMSTTQAFLGENLEGTWRIVTSHKLKRVQMNQHHFMANDIVAHLNVEAELAAPRPSLAHAKRLIELAPEHSQYWREQNTLSLSGMTIGGKEPKLDSYEDMVAQLQSLPSAFKTRKRIFSELPMIDGDTDAGQKYIAANHAHVHSLEDSLHKAAMYNAAADAYRYAGDDFNLALTLGKAAHQYLYFVPLSLEHYAASASQAISLLEEAILVHKTAGRVDLAYNLIDDLYAAHGVCWRHANQIANVSAAENEAAAMRSLRHEHQSLWNQFMGGADPGAHRIEEGEMGFSDHERIGTDNVWPCVTIIARNPETKKTGLVHLDNEANLKTLDSFFSKFGNNRLDVRIIGANSRRSPHSKANIEKVMKYLVAKNINIVSADILGGSAGPAALVVDPQTFEVNEHVPAKASVNADIGNSVLLFTKRDKPLVMQFDYTESKKRAPIFLSGSVLKHIREEFLPRNEAELDAEYRKLGFTARPRLIEHILGLTHAYKTEWNAMNEALDTVIEQNQLAPADAARARGALLKQRFFVGENAREANQPIYDWIQNDLIRDGQVQYTALQGVRLDNKAHRLSFSEHVLQGGDQLPGSHSQRF